MDLVAPSYVRPQVTDEDIREGMEELFVKLSRRLTQKGRGAFSSRHEILGILVEEMDEIIEAIRDDSTDGYEHFRKELLDGAVAMIFGYICMGNYIKP